MINGVTTFLSRFCPILFIFAGNDDRHKILSELEFLPDLITDLSLTRALVRQLVSF